MCPLEYELQSELQQARRSSLQDLAELRRRQIVFRQHEIRMIQCVECFRAKLKVRFFCHGKALEQRNVHCGNARPPQSVATLITKLARIRGRSQLLKGAAAHPLVRRVRTRVAVSNNIRAARSK